MVRSAEELVAIEKMAAQSMSMKKIAETVGVPLSTTKRWLNRLRSEGEMVSRNVGRPRGAEAGLCLLSLQFRLASLELRVECGVRFDSAINSGTSSRNYVYCWHHCRHSMLHSRHCSQTSPGIWHRAHPSQRPGVHEGGALASEAGDMWGIACASPLHSCFGPSTR